MGWEPDWVGYRELDEVVFGRNYAEFVGYCERGEAPLAELVEYFREGGVSYEDGGNQFWGPGRGWECLSEELSEGYLREVASRVDCGGSVEVGCPDDGIPRRGCWVYLDRIPAGVRKIWVGESD